jgi:uncharacterized damage-inducible protein DinB
MEFGHFLVDTFAYMPPANALSDLDGEAATRRPSDNVHSIAEIVAHITFWQDWFLRRCQGEDVPMAQQAALGWPPAPASEWEALRAKFLNDASRLAALGNEPGAQEKPLTPAIDFPPLAHYTVRDALVHVATHNAHHLGQIITLRQVMGTWPPPSGSWTW